MQVNIFISFGASPGFTVVTSCWGNGTAGPLFMNVVPGEYNQKILNDFNEEHKGLYYVNVSETESHFMTAESTCIMYECLYKDAFRMQRVRCQKDGTARGALQCDDFSGNRAEKNGHAERRQKFSQAMNVALPLRKRGGWSAKGSVCDAFHAEYRRLQDHVEDEHLGFNASLSDRTPLKDLIIRSNGTVHRHFEPISRIQVNVNAWEKMPPKVFRWSLISRGIISPQRLIEMTGQSMDEHEKEMKEAKVLEDPFGLAGASALLPVPVHEVCPACVTKLYIASMCFQW